jgi:hypothetical protein
MGERSVGFSKFVPLKSRSVSTKFDPHNPRHCHHNGTLRELYGISTSLSNEECPPLNAISLPGHKRNLYIPCQYGNVASHEVAQSRVPCDYDAVFDVPDVRAHMEWSLIGTKGTVSPIHADSDGLGTAVVILEGSKYWIVVTQFGEEDIIGSFDSLGPSWNPYLVNDGGDANRFRFEGMHLQKGDMLWVLFCLSCSAADGSDSIMPGGVPHFVLGTSNSICVGRHFYSTSTIRRSVIAIAQTFILGGALTNDDNLETRTLLYQLLVFWSMRLDKTDVDGGFIL